MEAKKRVVKKRKTIEDKLKDRVRAGIAFLNVVRPGWFRKINTNKLDLSNANVCILGQIEGDFFSGKMIHNLDQSLTVNMGFEADFPVTDRYPLLTKFWKREVLKLKRR